MRVRGWMRERERTSVYAMALLKSLPSPLCVCDWGRERERATEEESEGTREAPVEESPLSLASVLKKGRLMVRQRGRERERKEKEREWYNWREIKRLRERERERERINRKREWGFILRHATALHATDYKISLSLAILWHQIPLGCKNSKKMERGGGEQKDRSSGANAKAATNDESQREGAPFNRWLLVES